MELNADTRIKSEIVIEKWSDWHSHPYKIHWVDGPTLFLAADELATIIEKGAFALQDADYQKNPGKVPQV